MSYLNTVDSHMSVWPKLDRPFYGEVIFLFRMACGTDWAIWCRFDFIAFQKGSFPLSKIKPTWVRWIKMNEVSPLSEVDSLLAGVEEGGYLGQHSLNKSWSCWAFLPCSGLISGCTDSYNVSLSDHGCNNRCTSKDRKRQGIDCQIQSDFIQRPVQRQGISQAPGKGR